MSEKQRFRLVHDQARQLATAAIWRAPEGWQVEIKPATRSLDQNAMFHSLCDRIAKAGIEWAGEKRTAEEWKALLVSAHAAATQSGFDLVRGIEGEMVQLRESTAQMTKARSSSLIEYTLAWAAARGIHIGEKS